MQKLETVDQIADRIVTQEVLCCISQHVTRLLQGPVGDGFLADLAPALAGHDWEVPAREAMDYATDEELGDLAMEYGLLESSPVPFSRREAEQALWAYGREDADHWRQIAQELDPHTDPYVMEALEFWIVSDWLAEKLEDQGEPVAELDGLPIWGRTCSGQKISMDGPILEIARAIYHYKP